VTSLFVRLVIAFFVAFAIAAVASPAIACKRPMLLPVELPLMKCPTRAEPAACLACLKTQRHVNLHYAGKPIAIGAAWAKALEADGWTVETIAPGPGDAVITLSAKRGHDRARTRVLVGAKPGRTVLHIVFTPA
jgi:hypothetical protein